MALTGVLRPGYIQVRVTDIDAALKHYVDRVGLHEVSREVDGRIYLRAWDEFDRHHRAEFEARARALVERVGS